MKKMFNKKNKEVITRSDDTKYGFDIKTTAMNEGRKLKWVSKLPLHLTMGVASVAILLSVGISVYSNDKLDENRQKIIYLSELRQENEKIEKNIKSSSKGSKEIFNLLRTSELNINNIIMVLKNGGNLKSEDYISPISNDMLEHFNLISNEWTKTQKLLNNLLKEENNLVIINKNLNFNKKDITSLMDGASEFNKILINKNDKNSIFSQELYLLSTRINNAFDNIYSIENNSIESEYLLVKDIRNFNNLLTAFTNGSDSLGVTKVSSPLEKFYLNSINKDFEKFKPLLNNLSLQMNRLNEINQTIIYILESNKKLSNYITDLDVSYSHKLTALNSYNYITIFLFIIGIASLALLILYSLDKEKKVGNAAKELEKNQNNQAAVNLLLQQVNPMDSGDFTQRIYVSDKFVTQIAEKFDKTRERIGNIVRKIKYTSSSIENNAINTENTSKRLLEVSNSQSDKIQKSNDKIIEITADMDSVAKTIWVALTNSNESTKASQDGVELISQSINKMDEIRNNIQESSKKIKKSSESAQAITEVTALIQVITRKIEILALNAAIQAASSGDAGREFTVVAEEVHRLAYDSKEATKQILELIKEVQEDINVAVSSMEKTTQEVVEGTKLTDNAGQALKQIKKLSEITSEKVEEVSERLIAKSSEMSDISVKMKDLQDTTQQSKEIVATIAGEVEGLKRISQELSNIVQGHKVES